MPQKRNPAAPLGTQKPTLGKQGHGLRSAADTGYVPTARFRVSGETG